MNPKKQKRHVDCCSPTQKAYSVIDFVNKIMTLMTIVDRWHNEYNSNSKIQIKFFFYFYYYIGLLPDQNKIKNYNEIN